MGRFRGQAYAVTKVKPGFSRDLYNAGTTQAQRRQPGTTQAQRRHNAGTTQAQRTIGAPGIWSRFPG